MQAKDVVNQIENLFEIACLGLFESLNCMVSRVYPNESELDEVMYEVPIACIDAGSKEVELNIRLQLPMSVLALTYPVQGEITAVNEEQLEDWIAELSNQLIGRLKAKLVAHNCFVSLGLPTTYFGAGIDDLIDGGCEKKAMYFDLDGEVCACHILIEAFSDELLFSVEVDECIDVLAEGEIELF